MVAEENKLGTKLGKRIKRLGIHQVLYDRYSPAAAAISVEVCLGLGLTMNVN